jgi:CRP-like cAMP-binding protein
MMNQPTVARNLLLARLPLTELDRFGDHLKTVPLDFKQVLYEARSAIDYIYFPTKGVLSAVAVMNDGKAVEVATIGNEGAAGVAALLGIGTSANRVFVQVPGEAQRIKVATLHDEALPGSPLFKLLLCYYGVFLTQVSQSVACNGLHPIQKRCCRWMLMTHDRVGANKFPLTHEFLAMMLGVARPGVSEVLVLLRKKRLLDYKRGIMTILDRKRLEAASCECYEAVKAEYARLLG